jgi:hypothetical protein
MKEKIIQLVNKVISAVKPKLVILDSKITTLIPNPKTKKILYIAVGSLFGFMFLIIILGIILSPFRQQDSTAEPEIIKRVLPTSGPNEPIILTDIQKEIKDLENIIKELRFPESTLNTPVVESDISL